MSDERMRRPAWALWALEACRLVGAIMLAGVVLSLMVMLFGR
jgi:hypothetical protein